MLCRGRGWCSWSEDQSLWSPIRSLRGANIYICTNSQVPLKARAKHRFKTKLVLEMLDERDTTGYKNRISVMWILGHINTKENDMAALWLLPSKISGQS